MSKSVSFLICVSAAVILLPAFARGNIVLTGTKQYTVNSYILDTGFELYDTSKASIVIGGNMRNFYSYEDSTVNFSGGLIRVNCATYGESSFNFSGGAINGGVDTHETSTMNFSGGTIASGIGSHESSIVNFNGGSVGTMFSRDASIVNISSGAVSQLWSFNSSNVNISGGAVGELRVYYSSVVYMSGGKINSALYAVDSSLITLHGQKYQLGKGLSLDGERLLGTGLLTGQWNNGTQWSMNIAQNDPTARIMLTPEPMTIVMLGLGGMMLSRRRRAR